MAIDFCVKAVFDQHGLEWKLMFLAVALVFVVMVPVITTFVFLFLPPQN